MISLSYVRERLSKTALGRLFKKKLPTVQVVRIISHGPNSVAKTVKGDKKKYIKGFVKSPNRGFANQFNTIQRFQAGVTI